MEALDKGNRGIDEGAVGRRAVNWGYCRGKGQEAEGRGQAWGTEVRVAGASWKVISSEEEEVGRGHMAQGLVGYREDLGFTVRQQP